jgi:hypothetical protein
VDEELVERLEGLLEGVKSGRTIGVAYALLASDGTFATNWAGACSRGKLGWAIQYLAHRYMRRCLNDDEDEK